jgi:hypothetical protein
MINTSPNLSTCELNLLPKIVKQFGTTGDVLEFGTFSCESAMYLSQAFPDNKSLPNSSDWSEGMFNLSHPIFAGNDRVPKNKEEALKKLEPYKNVKMIISDVHDLKDPSDYGISKISLVNLDVDIYEPSVSSLEFVSKCVWDKLFIRFDDWHGGEKEYDEHERLAFVEWIEKYNYKFEITHGGYIGGVFVER